MVKIGKWSKKVFKKYWFYQIFCFTNFTVFNLVCYDFYWKFTAVNCKKYLPFTNSPTSGISFKKYTTVNFYHGKL
jgi:hypothetical protein